MVMELAGLECGMAPPEMELAGLECGMALWRRRRIHMRVASRMSWSVNAWGEETGACMVSSCTDRFVCGKRQVESPSCGSDVRRPDTPSCVRCGSEVRRPQCRREKISPCLEGAVAAVHLGMGCVELCGALKLSRVPCDLTGICSDSADRGRDLIRFFSAKWRSEGACDRSNLESLFLNGL